MEPMAFATQLPIPILDPTPLPGPVWLLKFLLLLTFLLHIIPMNFALGGGFIAAVAEWRGREQSKRLARDIARMMPGFIAFTITLGVAPLLFVQLLYGHLLYTSSILMGGPWMSIVLLLMLAYYGHYYYSMRGGQVSGVAVWVALVSSVFFAVIGFLFTNNMTLMLVPERWAAIYAADPTGWNLNLAEPMVIPRYVHMLVGAFAVSGMILALRGVWELRKDETYARWIIRHGAEWFTAATVVNYLVGLWFAFSLPSEHARIFHGGSAAATFGLPAGILLSVGAMMLIQRAADAEGNPARYVGWAFACLLLTLVAMTLVRDALRTSYLAAHFDLGAVPVATQVTPLLLFLVSFLVGLGVLAWMLKQAVPPSLASGSGD